MVYVIIYLQRQILKEVLCGCNWCTIFYVILAVDNNSCNQILTSVCFIFSFLFFPYVSSYLRSTLTNPGIFLLQLAILRLSLVVLRLCSYERITHLPVEFAISFRSLFHI